MRTFTNNMTGNTNTANAVVALAVACAKVAPMYIPTYPSIEWCGVEHKRGDFINT